jgi:FdhD protein
MLPGIVQVKVWEYSKGEFAERELPVSAEYPVVLKLNGSPFVSISCSGSDMEYLAVGHLISEGVVTGREEIDNIEIDHDLLEINISLKMTDEVVERLFRIRSIASGCGQGGVSIVERNRETERDGKGVEVDAEGVISSMKNFLKHSEHHKLTRGVHSAALYDLSWKQIVFFDEIGRHNAIDKIIGYASSNGISLADKCILSTGRLSSEIVSKAVNVSVPLLISKASPTDYSVRLARKHKIIMIGKVRGSGFSIFSGREMVKA